MKSHQEILKERQYRPFDSITPDTLILAEKISHEDALMKEVRSLQLKIRNLNKNIRKLEDRVEKHKEKNLTLMKRIDSLVQYIFKKRDFI